MNKCELAGLAITIFVVTLGLSYTVRGGDGADGRYVVYFAIVQVLFLLYSFRATALDVAAVGARMAVERKVAELYSRVCQARREGFLLSERTRSTRLEPPRSRSIERTASDEGSGSTRIPRLRSRLGSMGSVANLVMRKNSTLSDADMLHLERHGRAVEESGGRLEILATFRGPALQNFSQSTGRHCCATPSSRRRAT